MKPRRDRRFKQWNKTKATPITDPRNSRDHRPVEVFTHDISIGGARLHAGEPFGAGTLLRLEIELVRTGEVLRVEGLVKWCEREKEGDVFEMGVEFKHTSMATVLSLMRGLHDARLSASKSEPGDLSRF
ncbi:MAG: PilZ domain-containing protein [Candidatus Aminicenantes bacterium]|nr:PilZ domain-containing protein [Candidatus Aminicenantes bacterium]